MFSFSLHNSSILICFLTDFARWLPQYMKLGCNIIIILHCLCTVLVVEMQWDIYVQCGRHICPVAYVNNVKCIYTSALGDIVDCSEFI